MKSGIGRVSTRALVPLLVSAAMVASSRGPGVTAFVDCQSPAGGKQAGAANPPCPGCSQQPPPPPGWDWGEVIVSAVEYRGNLKLRNECDIDVTVTFALEAPYIKFLYLLNYPDVSLRAGEEREVMANVKIPRPPCTLFLGPGQAGWNPYPPFGGRLRLTYVGQGDRCLTKIEEYPISGKLVFPKGPCPDDEPKPEKLQTTDPCMQWWLTGERPESTVDLEAACLNPIRELAAAFRERALEPIAATDLAKWKWLPSAAEIRSMSIADILAMRARAEAIITGR